MMHGNVFRIQLASDLGNRRRVVMRVGISLLLALPFILVGMPPRVQAAGIVMVVLFTSFFGAAVGFARLREDLRFTRLALLPVSRSVLWLDLILASVLARLAPVMVVLIGFIVVNGQGVTPVFLVCLLGLLSASMVLITMLGMGTGRLARSNGEVHLLGALICGVFAFVSGITPLPERLGWLKAVMVWNPVTRLLSTLTGLVSGTASVPRAEFVFTSLIVGAVTVTAVLRWTSGGMKNIGNA